MLLPALLGKVPRLAEPNPHFAMVQQRKATLDAWAQAHIDRAATLETLRRLAAVARASDDTAHLPAVSMRGSRRTFRHIFLPRNINFAGNVFGGDFLEWLEVRRVVEAAGRQGGQPGGGGVVDRGRRCGGVWGGCGGD